MATRPISISWPPKPLEELRAWVRETGVPVIFEVLATESLADAEARAGGPHGNKGWDAAEAALETADLLDRLPQERRGRPDRRRRDSQRDSQEEGSLR